MKGTVCGLNRERSFVLVNADGDGYAVLELYDGGSATIGDVISEITQRQGVQKVTNETQQRRIDVFVQALANSPEYFATVFEDG